MNYKKLIGYGMSSIKELLNKIPLKISFETKRWHVELQLDLTKDLFVKAGLGKYWPPLQFGRKDDNKDDSEGFQA
jgi:hypothetical protein